MDITLYIIDYLHQNKTVVLPRFGALSITNTSAQIQTEQASFAPPVYEINFVRDLHSESIDFSKYVAEKLQQPHAEIHEMLKQQINAWNDYLDKNQELYIANVGSFYYQNEALCYTPDESLDHSADYFGLEPLDFKSLEQQEFKEEKSKLATALVWIFLIILPTLGLLGGVYYFRDYIFNPQKAKNISVDTPSNHKIK
jgi:nucleoid DNA-binding protein